MREVDTLTRLGGDEFLLMLEQTSSRAAVAEFARELIAQPGTVHLVEWYSDQCWNQHRYQPVPDRRQRCGITRAAGGHRALPGKAGWPRHVEIPQRGDSSGGQHGVRVSLRTRTSRMLYASQRRKLRCQCCHCLARRSRRDPLGASARAERMAFVPVTCCHPFWGSNF